MRILVVGSNYWPEKSGNATFVVRRCEYLASRGHEVVMCTGFPYYPEWKVPQEYRRQIFQREVHDGVKIVRSYLYVPKRVNSAKRVMHEATFLASSLVRALGQQKPDLLLVVSAPLGLALSAFVLSRAWKVPHVFHVQDMQPDAAGDLGMLPKPVVRWLYRLERFAYRDATLVSALTEGMRQRIILKGIPPEKIEVFSHCADEALFEVPLAGGGKSFRRRFGLGDRFLVVHSGNMGIKQGLEVVVSAAERTRHDAGIAYLMVGDGVARASLERRVATLGLSNIKFLPLQPSESFGDTLAAADVCVVTERGSVGDILFPGKLATFLTAGRPVIASLDDGSEAARVVVQSGAGMLVAAEDPESLVEAILKMRVDAAARAEMSVRGRAYAREHWDPARLLPFMEARLTGLVTAAESQKQAA
jgi:colanic acid biosynthesis glycosyl transferase WcaI